MVHHPQPLDEAYAPPAYPRPDDGDQVQRVVLYAPPNLTEGAAGHLMLGGTALEWLPLPAPDRDSVAAIIQSLAAAALREGARDGTPPAQVFQALRSTVPSTPVQASTAGEVRKDVRRAWAH